MNTNADKAPKHKSESVAHETPSTQGGFSPNFSFADKRPEAVAQKRMQNAINDSSKVKQLKNFQALGNKSPLKMTQRLENREEEPLQEQQAGQTGNKAVSQRVLQKNRTKLKTGMHTGGAVIQAIIDSNAFRLQTPGTLFRPRKTVDTIDTALDNYHAAVQGNKLTALGALMTAINIYRASKAPDPADTRLAAVNNLRLAVLAEEPLVIKLDLLAQNAIAANLVTIAPFAAVPDGQLTDLAALPQATNLADLAQLRALTRAHADILTLAAIQYGGRGPLLPEMTNLDLIPLARIQTLAAANLAQAPTWAELQRLIAIAGWSAADVILVANAQLGGATPTLQQMEQVSAFTVAELGKLGQAGSWARIVNLAKIHAAPINADPSEDVTTAMAAMSVNEHKENVAGVLDQTRSCWNWATQGFEDAEVPDDTIFAYFSRRTNFPIDYGGALSHVQAVNFIANTPAALDPIRVYLNRNQVALQNIVATWQANLLIDVEQANQTAQLTLMRLHLSESGFNVLAQGTNSRWYICMHELKNNVGWEHWWIKTRAGDVIETFPVTADGRGRFIAFHQSQVNMGDTNTDFRHEVPVADLLPAQLDIIRRALTRYKGKITAKIA